MSNRGSLGLPDPEQRAWLLEALAELLRRADAVHFLCSPIVLPTPAYFPDRWTRSVAGVQRLLRRLFGYADLDELEPAVELFDSHPPEPRGAGQATHHSGAAGLFLGLEDGVAYFGADARLLDDPGGITATLAHEVAHAYRTHHGLCVEDSEVEEPLTDLTSVFLGFGVFSANAALRHRSGLTGDGFATSKWSVSRLGYLSPQELCFVLAAQVHLRGPERAPLRPIVDHLETNQAAFFKESLRWLQREKPDLAEMFGLPPRSEWPPPDSLAALTRALDDTHDDLEVDTVAALDEAPALSNVGRSVFRVARRPREQRRHYGLLVAIAGLVMTVVVSASGVAVLIVAGLTVVAIRLSGRYLSPRCSDPDCRAQLTYLSATCPGCRGTIAGNLDSADDRLEAQEALYRQKRASP